MDVANKMFSLTICLLSNYYEKIIEIDIYNELLKKLFNKQ